MSAPPNVNNELIGIDIEIIKEKIKTILEKYLADRDYISNKVDIWKETILSEIEKFLSNYIDFKFGVNIEILNKTIKNRDYLYTSACYKNKNYIKYFYVEFKSKKIYSIIDFYLFKKNNINKFSNLDLNETMTIIEKDFINFFEGRNYETIKLKYYEMFKKKFFDETIKNLKSGFQYCILYSNKFYEYTMKMMIINKDESDLSEEKLFKNDDNSLLYVGLSKIY